MTPRGGASLFDPLDRLRRSLLGVVLDVRPLRHAMADKDRRIALQSVALVLVAAAVSLALPIVPLLVSPLVLGVPHLASEARVLLAQGRVARPLVRLSMPFAAVLVLLGLSTAIGAVDRSLSARIEVGVATLWIAVAVARARGPVRAPLLAIAFGVAATALVFPAYAAPLRDLGVGLHAFVTVALWLAVFRRDRRYGVPLVVLMAIGLMLTAACRGPLVASAFLLNVHYAVWLVLVPQDAAPSSGLSTFRMTARALRRDFGSRGLFAIGALSLLVLVAAAVKGATTARDAYIATAQFHVWAEVVLGATLLARTRATAPP